MEDAWKGSDPQLGGDRDAVAGFGSPEPPAPSPGRGARRGTRLVMTGAAAVLLVWFAVANLQGVRIRFWVVSESAPLVVVVAISAFLGAAASMLWSWALRRRRRSASSR